MGIDCIDIDSDMDTCALWGCDRTFPLFLSLFSFLFLSFFLSFCLFYGRIFSSGLDSKLVYLSVLVS